MNYVGKSVEFKAHGGTYQGIVSSLENNKITLESVKYCHNGQTTELKQIRVSADDLDDTKIKILRRSNISNVSTRLNTFLDDTKIFESKETQKICHRQKRAKSEIRSNKFISECVNNAKKFPLESSPIPLALKAMEEQKNGWAKESSNVFPPDDEFDSERDFHAHHFFLAESLSKMDDKDKFVVISDPHLYPECLRIINGEKTVYLSIFGNGMSRDKKPDWIAVSTNRGVFIFDMVNISRELCQETKLADFLEGDSPRKVICDSRFVADSLLHNFNVKLNICEDLLAMQTYMYCMSNWKAPRNAWNIIDLLHLYCPFTVLDLDIIGYRFLFAQYDGDIWNVPACFAKKSLIHLIVYLTNFLRPLHYEMTKALMKPIELTTRIFLDNFKNLKQVGNFKDANQIPDTLPSVFHQNVLKVQHVNNQTQKSNYHEKYIKAMGELSVKTKS